MTLSPGAKVQPNRSTLRSPAGFRAACSSMLSDRAPTPPRFMGHSTWMSRMGSRPKRWARLHQVDDPRHGGFGIVRLYEIEVAVALGLGEVRNRALIDPMGAGDDPAVGGLAEDLGQPHDGYSAGRDDVGQNLTWPDRGELIDIADNQQRGMVGYGFQQGLHQQDVDHGRLVDDQQVAIERVLAAAFEAPGLRVDFKQPVNGLGLEAGGFRH